MVDDGSEMRRSPGEVGSLSQVLLGFIDFTGCFTSHGL